MLVSYFFLTFIPYTQMANPDVSILLNRESNKELLVKYKVIKEIIAVAM